MRKILQYFLVLILFLTSACNLPTRTPPGSPNQTANPTFNPATFPTKTVTPNVTQGQPTPVFLTPSPQVQGVQPVPTQPLAYDPSRFVAYAAQSGDTLAAVAAHFGTVPGAILSDPPPNTSGGRPLPSRGLLPNHQMLIIPKPTDPAPYPRFLLPDSEIVNSACGRGFDIQKIVQETGGELSVYSQVVDSRSLSGADIVRRVSDNTSVNPRFLLAFIEFRSGWVLGKPAAPNLTDPLELKIPGTEGLFPELSVYAQLLNSGYYGWRGGKLSQLTFLDGGSVPIAPELNAGSVALQYLFARSLPRARWEADLYGPDGFLTTYQKLFSDPLACVRASEPLFPDGVQAPALELPFAPGEAWALTGGLHEDWTVGTPLGALDFAPITGEPPCSVSRVWVLASAAGSVTRSENGLLQLALEDGGGKPTGWELLYMHIAGKDRVPVGTRVKTNDPLGHPSCEGGLASGSHVHLARIYHGEWIGAGDPFPYILSGWLAVPGEKSYSSSLVKGDRTIVSNIEGKVQSWITR